MRMLVAVASRHGATQEIARCVGDVLTETLWRHDPSTTVDVCMANDVTRIDGYDAVVLGSAVYLGRWLDDARRFTDTHAATLTERPVWLFSSGIADPNDPAAEPADAVAAQQATRAHEHRRFRGRLDRTLLSAREKTLLASSPVPDGDFRDWTAIRTWARDVADTLVRT